jgi:hypothetical protein
MDDRLLAFVGVSVAVAVVPGPDMALVARSVVRHGRSAGFAASLGIETPSPAATAHPRIPVQSPMPRQPGRAIRAGSGGARHGRAAS